jgi:hypothetical protein
MVDEEMLQLHATDEWLSKLNDIMIEGERKHFRFFSRLSSRTASGDVGTHQYGNGCRWLTPP